MLTDLLAQHDALVAECDVLRAESAHVIAGRIRGWKAKRTLARYLLRCKELCEIEDKLAAMSRASA